MLWHSEELINTAMINSTIAHETQVARMLHYETRRREMCLHPLRKVAIRLSLLTLSHRDKTCEW